MTPSFQSETLRPRIDLGLREKLSRLSWTLCVLLLLLGMSGAAMLYSIAGGAFDDYAEAHLARFSIGFALMLFVALIDLRVWLRLAPVIYAMSLALLALVALDGASAGGATRWLPALGGRIQPSEIAKVALVLALAAYYHRRGPSAASKPGALLIAAALIAAPTALVAAQPDLGTAGLIVASGVLVMFAAGVAWPVFVIGGAVIAVAAALALVSRGGAWQILHDYQYRRIDAFLNPEAYRLTDGYQITQSKIAIGAGGLEGVGFGQGALTRNSFLPEPRTDFIFTSLAEEFGLLGGLALIALCLAICGVGALAALRVRSRFGRLLGFGVLGVFFAMVTLNIAMVTGLAPVVGAPLPLVSYAGNATLALLVGFGLLLSAQAHGRDPLAPKPLRAAGAAR